MRRIISLITLLCITPFFLFAQTQQIKGTVIDEKGAPIAGVTVMTKGTQNGTQTDALGKFTLSVAGSAGKVTLIFSYLGYKKQETSTDGSKPVDVRLDKEDNSLEDVVVIGYGTARRKDLTGSVSSVGSKDLSIVVIKRLDAMVTLWDCNGNGRRIPSLTGLFPVMDTCVCSREWWPIRQRTCGLCPMC